MFDLGVAKREPVAATLAIAEELFDRHPLGIQLAEPGSRGT
jgi:hypothetical protein